MQLKQLGIIYQLEQLISQPSRITQTSSTLIDVILTNEPSRILSSGVLHIGRSDHSFVYAVRKFSIPSKNTHKYVITRSFKNLNADAFRNDMRAVSWNSIDNCNTMDEMIENWYNMFTAIANNHAPIRSRRVQNKKSPWLTAELRQLITNCDQLKKQAIVSNDSELWNKFKKERNRTNNEIKKAKAHYYRSQVEINYGNPKGISRVINEITHRKSTNNSSINDLIVNDESVTKPSNLCEILNSHFTSVGPNLDSAIPVGNRNFESYISQTNTVFNLQHTTMDVVLKHLKKLSPHKTTGLDNISCRLLKEAAPIISDSLTVIINKSIDTGFFPSKWKIAKVFSLYKVENRTDPQNYRPISVLPAISKICERIVYDQLYAYLNENDLLTKHQSGFRPLHSTVTAFLDITNE